MSHSRLLAVSGRRFAWPSGLLLACFLVSSLAPASADPSRDLAYTLFAKTDLAALSNGEILSQRGTTNLPRGLVTQSVFIVKAPAANAYNLILRWDPTRHKEMQVYYHVEIKGVPDPTDFAKVDPLTGSSAAQRLANDTMKITGSQNQLQVTHAEAQAFMASAKGNPPEAAGAFWQQILTSRSKAFAAGGVNALPPYETGAGGAASVTTINEIRSLLKDQPGVANRFGPLVASAGSNGNGDHQYWELFNADGTGTLVVGSAVGTTSKESSRIADLQFYASGSFYVSFTCYEIWPIQVDGKEAALIWRGDFVSAPMLAITKGSEKMAAGMLMIQQVKNAIRYLRADIGG